MIWGLHGLLFLGIVIDRLESGETLKTSLLILGGGLYLHITAE